MLAPVEAAYSHSALLHISAFLNEAWPPPERDPLAVKANISLRKEVREAARASRLSQLQRAQQGRLPSIQVPHAVLLPALTESFSAKTSPPERTCMPQEQVSRLSTECTAYFVVAAGDALAAMQQEESSRGTGNYGLEERQP